MLMGKLILLVLSVFLVLPVSAQTFNSEGTIKKCQDADGNWHYGDHASFECEQNSRITEIDMEGDTVGEIEAPPTPEELEAKLRAEEQMSEQVEAEAAQKRTDQRLLITYDNADRILQTRDALLAALDSAIEADQILKDRLADELKKLRNSGNPNDAGNISSVEQQIADFDEAIRDRLAKRELAREKYDLDYKRYKELTGT